jgi:predicted nuclease of predicted toxin-antitoxin system
MNAPRLFAWLYLDEDVPVQVAEILRGHGYDVRTARDGGMLGTSDSEQLAYAAEQGIGVCHT